MEEIVRLQGRIERLQQEQNQLMYRLEELTGRAGPVRRVTA